MMRYIILVFFIWLQSCNSDTQVITVQINIKGAAGKKISVYKIGFLEEADQLQDTAMVIDLNHPIVFKVQQAEQRLYKIQVDESGHSYIFIGDTAKIIIDINDINGKYAIANSTASISLKTFTDQQTALSTRIGSLSAKLDSMALRPVQKSEPILMQVKYKVLVDSLYSNYIRFADTTASPAAFLAVYNLIDLGNKYDQLKSFIDHAAFRFSYYAPIVKLKAEVYAMLSIYAQEFNVGDSLPLIELPDETGKVFSTRSLKNKYYFIDFWSTWCTDCNAYNNAKKLLWKTALSQKLQIISVALDDDKKPWLNAIRNNDMHWTQLIDEKMWRGPAANTLKFDSIPFNFLVGPGGSILAKAIPADSLNVVIAKFVK